MWIETRLSAKNEPAMANPESNQKNQGFPAKI